ncbi:MAG: hypothetical protein NTY33_02940 [Candidatus Moranbacteria bacterium]|nr:hypothetical protein [Candidatus Moranbacteria bacterium]
MLAFFEGIIAALGALVLELTPPVFGLAMSETALVFLLFTASVEEIIKFAFIYNHYLELSVKEKILADAVFIGFGFALVDIVSKQISLGKNTLGPLAGILLVHLITTTLLGLFLWRKNQKPLPLSLLIVILNILLHFSYNFLLLRYF